MQSLLATPALGPCNVDLRDYQVSDIDRIRTAFASKIKDDLGIERPVKRALYTLATGLGKTTVAAAITRRCIEKGGRLLYLAHRKELIDQPANTFDRFGIEAGIEKANQFARSLYNPDAVIASVQTLKGKRLESFKPDHFAMIIVDEAHHCVCESYMRILKYFKSARVLGMTATADRSDEEDLGQVFDVIVPGMNIFEGIKSGYLCDVKYELYDADVDLRNLRATDGDFTDKDLEERIAPMVGALANGIKELAERRQTLVFTPQVKSAMGMATALRSLGMNAEWIAGDDQDRSRKFDQYKRGELQVLVNCSLFLEGTDAPETSAIGLCRPTKSRPLLTQIIGRGTRRKEGEYKDCLIIDFNYITDKHSLVGPTELFDTPLLDNEVHDIAGQMLKDKPKQSILACMEEAERVHRERAVLRIKAREQKVGWKRVSYRPMDVYETMGIPWRQKRDSKIVPATDGQVRYLGSFGVENAENLSKTKAKTLIDYLKNRREQGLATMKQVSHLIKNGVTPEIARAMTFDQAHAKLDEIWGPKR